MAESEKNLPIKFFQKRQKDEQNTEGGGDRKLPRWVNDKEALIEKAVYINDVLNDISISISKKTSLNNYIPSVIKLKLNEDALAKTYRKEIGNIFNVGGINIIGVGGEDEVLVKIDDLNDLRAMAKKVTNAYDAFPSYTTKVGISAITNIEEFKPEVDVTLDNKAILKVKLFNYGSNNLNDILITTFERFCETNNVRFNRTVYSEELNIYRIDSISEEIFEELKNFDGVQLLTEMPTYSIILDELTEENSIPLKLPKQDINYPIVGVLDTGIAKIPTYLHGYILKAFPNIILMIWMNNMVLLFQEFFFTEITWKMNRIQDLKDVNYLMQQLCLILLS